jgi:hypothetical protein
MRHEKLLRRGWAHLLLAAYAAVLLAVMIAAGGAPKP